MRRRLSLLVNVVLSLVALGALLWSAALVRGTAGLTRTAATSSSVRTVTVSQGTVTATVTADGTLEATTTASAGFGTSGTVTAVYVKPGDKVTKGTVLAKVDPAAAQRALALANANLAAAEDAVTRAAAASSDNASAVNAVAQAQIAVADAKAGVAATSLTAPIAGTVTAVNGTIGSSATGSATSSGEGQKAGGFVELADLSALQVAANFSEADATQLKTGQLASITWSALTGATATGRVLSIDPSATTTGSVVTYGVTTSIGTLPTGARPGQSVTVKVTTGTAQNATYVNSAAVTLSGSTYTVKVRKSDGTTETRTVKVGLEGDDADQIVAGLSAGETVVVPAPTSSSSAGINRNQGPGEGRFNGGPP